jgi:hypothetical protein
MSRQPLQLNITFLGRSGAGKSTLLREFARSLDKSRLLEGFKVVFKDHALIRDKKKYPDSTTSNPEPLTGTLTAYKTSFNLSITDRRGGEMGEGGGPGAVRTETLRRAAESHLLVLVLDPHTIARGGELGVDVNQMLTHVQEMKKVSTGKPRAMIAIAYTKADEYGLSEDVPPAFVRTAAQRQAFEAWADALRTPSGATTAGQRWVEFVDLVAPGGPGDPSRGARREVLLRTQAVWEALVWTYEIDPDAINGYFITAVPTDPHIDPVPVDRTGIPQLFLDFFQKVCERYNPPAWPWWGSVAAAAAGVLMLAVGLGVYWNTWWVVAPAAAALAAAGVGGAWLPRLWSPPGIAAAPPPAPPVPPAPPPPRG